MGRKGKCIVEGCNNEYFANGYCGKHLYQFNKYGKIPDRIMTTKNEIILCDDYAEIILYDKNCEEIAKTLIDLDDVEKCKEYKWHLSKEGYVIGLKNEKRIKLHRLLLDLQDNNYCVDHINRNPLDNRKSNLRICTNADNAINKNINRANKSGVIGVSWYKVRNKWVASIGFNNKKKTLGYFENFDDAVRVRLKAEKEYFGEFAPQRHLFEQYEIA